MKRVFLLIAISTFNIGYVTAQCAMCRAVPASNMQGGGTVGSTLNTGILYLMAIPYVLLISGAVYVFRKQIAEKIKQFRTNKA